MVVTGQYEVTAITETEYKNNLELETHAEPDNNEALAADDLILQYQCIRLIAADEVIETGQGLNPDHALWPSLWKFVPKIQSLKRLRF